MATKRLPMRKVRQILNLKYETGRAHREIAKACSVGAATVSRYLQRACEVGLSWPLAEELDDATLEAHLFNRPVGAGAARALPDGSRIHQERKRPGVTLQLLWLESLEVHPHGDRYSQFCERYRRWRGKLSPAMRQPHRPGENVFEDFSGKRLTLVERQTGALISVELFVSVRGASSFTYAEAVARQDLVDWIGVNTRMLEYDGGGPAIFVPDHLKSAVTTGSRYEPVITRTFDDFAAHYGAVVIPARTAKSKDKAKVESAVRGAQRWLLARLRHRTFFSLTELNAAIRELLVELNARPLRRLGVSRRALFEPLDRPALRNRSLERRAREHRLPPRARAQPLLRPLPALGREARSALPRHRRRALPQRPAYHRSPSSLRSRKSLDQPRAQARGPPGSHPVDAFASHCLGREIRARHRAARLGNPQASPPPRAGLPRVSGDPALGPTLRG